MLQSRLDSLIEAVLNVVIGFIISIIAQLIVFPAMGIHIPIVDNFIICGIFTAISIVRSFVLRRYFNRNMNKMSKAIAGLFRT